MYRKISQVLFESTRCKSRIREVEYIFYQKYETYYDLRAVEEMCGLAVFSGETVLVFSEDMFRMVERDYVEEFGKW